MHVTMGDYVKGFILAVILTVIPFWLVMNDVIQDRSTLVMVLGVLAAAQVVVHLVYFLHMNGKIQGGWTLMSTIFAVIFLGITLAGTLWVMYHMNTNMMPSHAEMVELSKLTESAPAAADAAAVQLPAAAGHTGHSGN